MPVLHICPVRRTSSGGTIPSLPNKSPSGKLCSLSLSFFFAPLDDWLTVHRSITLVNFHLDAQNSYLFIYYTFIKILYMFRAVRCSSSGGLILSMQYLISSLSVGDCPVHRLRKFLTGAQDSHLQRVTIPEAA